MIIHIHTKQRLMIAASLAGIMLLMPGWSRATTGAASFGRLSGLEIEPAAMHWHSPPGVDGQIHALASFGDVLYVGGSFTYAGGIIVNNVATWDGSNWAPLGGGVEGTVYALAVDDDGTLYAGGTFARAGGEVVNYIGSWNGEQWSPLNTGFDHPVYAAAIGSDGTLYAGGAIRSSNGVELYFIAQWDGEQWDRLGGGDDPDEYIVAPCGTFWYQIGGGTNHHVMALAPDEKGGLYVGGGFTEAYGITAHQVAYWNGSVWSSLGSAMNDSTFGRPVKALAYHQGVLYAGGLFASAGSASGTAYIAAWDGHRWSALGKGVNATVLTLAHDGNVLYAGGYFTRAGDVRVNHLARWDGREWSDVEGGIEARLVNALHVDEAGTLHAGGEISAAGGIAAGNLACFDLVTTFTRVDYGSQAKFILHPAFPSPFDRSTTISFSLPSPAHVSLRVFDALGREVALLVEGWRSSGIHLTTLDAISLPNGMYVVRMETDSHAASRTVLLMR